MNFEIYKILSNIDKVYKFTKYKEFPLHIPVSIKNSNDLKNLINELNSEPNTICLYNKNTLKVDIIGVVDIKGVRYIDFDDNIYTMTNKGIDNQVSDYID